MRSRYPKTTFICRFIYTVSLIMAVIVLGFWCRSHYCVEDARIQLQSRSRTFTIYVASMPGSLGFQFNCLNLPASRWKFNVNYNRHPKHFGAVYLVPQNTSSRWNAFGFAFGIESYSTLKVIQLNLPHWFVEAMLATCAALIWYYRHALLSRAKLGRCHVCGYSLFGNMSGVCPECGTACKVVSPASGSPAAGN